MFTLSCCLKIKPAVGDTCVCLFSENPKLFWSSGHLVKLSLCSLCMSGKQSGHFDQSLTATSSKTAKESRRDGEEAGSNDVRAAIEGHISEHNVLCSSGGNLRDKRQRTASCLENTVDAPDRDSSTKDGSINLPLHHEISFEDSVRSTATPFFNRVFPTSAATSAWL